MSVRRRLMRKAEDAARRAVGPDPTDEPRLKFLSSDGEPTTRDRIENEEADVTDGTGLYAIQELAQQDFDRLVQEAAEWNAMTGDEAGETSAADGPQDEGPVDSGDDLDSL